MWRRGVWWIVVLGLGAGACEQASVVGAGGSVEVAVGAAAPSRSEGPKEPVGVGPEPVVEGAGAGEEEEAAAVVVAAPASEAVAPVEEGSAPRAVAGAGAPAGEPRAMVELKRPKVLGGPDRAIVERVVRRRQGELLDCYRRAWPRGERPEGEVVLKLYVDSVGRVGRAQVVEGTLRHPTLRRCLERYAQRWRFPSGSCGITIIDQPLRFWSAR